MSKEYKIKNDKLVMVQTLDMDISLIVDILTSMLKNNGYWQFRDGYSSEYDRSGKFRREDMETLEELGILKTDGDDWTLTYYLKDDAIIGVILRDLKISSVIDED